MGMAEVMLGKELHPDRVIPVEELYEILNEYGINYSFPAQYGIENNAFAVVRCKDCEHYFHYGEGVYGCRTFGMIKTQPDGFCSRGERGDGNEV